MDENNKFSSNGTRAKENSVDRDYVTGRNKFQFGKCNISYESLKDIMKTLILRL